MVPALAALTGERLKADFPHLLSYWQEHQFTLIPIPLHRHRSNWRGFNQSALLAKELSILLCLPYSDQILTRPVSRSPQAQLKDKQLRHANASSVFQLNERYPSPSFPKGGGRGRFILFDDVATTGSTLSSAASVFPPNSEIWGLTLAG